MEIDHPGGFVEQTSMRAPSIRSAPTSTTGFVGDFPSGPTLEPTVVETVTEFEAVFDPSPHIGDGSSSEAAVAVHDFFASGGRRAVVVRSGSDEAVSTVRDLVAALATLTAASGLEPVQLVAMPDMARRVDRFSADEYRRLVRSAADFCRDNQMFLLVDPNTTGDDVEDITAWVATMSGWMSSNSAVYFPRLVTPASLDAGLDRVPASGSVAGVMARTDARHGVWTAPAGVAAVIDARVPEPMSESDQSPLNRHGVNVIRELPLHGTVIWGSRTRAASIGDDYRFVPVRRTALFIERSVDRGLQWSRAESNDPAVWREVRLSVEEFLSALWREGAFVGDRSDEAFFVTCDRSTMTWADVRRGRTIVQIGFAPLRPAEFVVLTVTVDRRSH